MPATCPAHLILFDLIILITSAKSMCYEAPHRAVTINKLIIVEGRKEEMGE
jgi:hypothetical protein